MQFSDPTTKTGLVEDTYFRIWGNSDDHSADYPLADIARYINRYYDMVVTKILQSDKTWNWDDTNKTDLPIKDLNIVSGQLDYSIPGSEYLKVSRVEIKDQNGNWQQLEFFTSDMLVRRALKDLSGQSGVPQRFRLQANSLFFDVTPNYSSTLGLRIFYQRNVDYFVSTDTTKKPGFAEMFHVILSKGAALEYCLGATGMDEKVSMLQMDLFGVLTRTKGRIGGAFVDLQDFYENRNDNKVRMTTAKNDYGEHAMGSGLSNGRGNNSPYGF